MSPDCNLVGEIFNARLGPAAFLTVKTPSTFMALDCNLVGETFNARLGPAAFLTIKTPTTPTEVNRAQEDIAEMTGLPCHQIKDTVMISG
jgi:hypothetical protein